MNYERKLEAGLQVNISISEAFAQVNFGSCSVRHHMSGDYTLKEHASRGKVTNPVTAKHVRLLSGQKWHTNRKIITPTFHFKILDRILQKEVRSQYFDVYPYITLCALDIICETTMGIPVYAQEDLESPYISAVYE
ncbi:cytochrome P450 4C1-like isoform X2 [Zootermopsis nevadensis]|uniref:cytochrome P450 4C1-like isoform X2 n=1 Tax=Zootermopsis nevadensis TaxID=136037 RepID=UPI000B8EA6DD|nr:cytochrome P450 4C1-like isoform X2 [Zootermopsis nevadensis]